MAHMHQVTDVKDTDPYFVIDPDTRGVTTESEKVILIQNDHNSERFTFEIPRYVDGHDMSKCNVVQVHYTNKDASNLYQSSGIYEITDLQVVSKSKDVVVGSWLVSMNATTFNGSLEFSIRYACVSNNSKIDYQWSTDIFTRVQVKRGIYNIDNVTNFEDQDILAAWKKEILDDAMLQSVDLIKEADTIIDELTRQASKIDFIPNFETGMLEYITPNYRFNINPETGNLEWEVI